MDERSLRRVLGSMDQLEPEIVQQQVARLVSSQYLKDLITSIPRGCTGGDDRRGIETTR
jgi:hypothetical protein